MRLVACGLLVLLACQSAPPAARQPVLVRVSSGSAGVLTLQGRQSQYYLAGGDEQRLLVGTYPTGRHGPLAAIHPVTNSYAHEAVEDPNGRLVARIINYDSLQGYAKLNLAPSDTVYWYVYPDTGDGLTHRSVLVSSRTQTVLLLPLSLHGEPVRARQAMARFLWRDDDETTWVVCTWTQCCRIE